MKPAGPAALNSWIVFFKGGPFFGIQKGAAFTAGPRPRPKDESLLKIFAAWSLGYFGPALQHVVPSNKPT